MKNTHQHSNTVADVDSLTITELSNTLYHIAQHTEVSKQYTRDFVEKCILKASELLERYSTLADLYDPFFINVKHYDDPVENPTPHFSQYRPNLCMCHGVNDDSNVIHTAHRCAFTPQITCLCCEEGIRFCMHP